jgi:predicted metal-dependent hydrolase
MGKESPLIVGFVSDLMFSSKIETVARRLDYEVAWIERGDFFGAEQIRDQPGEPISGGQTANLTEYLSESQPQLLIFDLENDLIPWRHWIAVIKSSPATRRIPILSFASHVNTETLEQAHKAGSDGVVTRGRFSEKLPDLINKYARRHDYAGILAACDEPLTELAIEGIKLFNRGEFYEAHHGLEDAWNEDEGPARELYRAILQVAVAYLQIERGNYRGAVKMFLRVRQWLDPLPDRCRGIDIAQLRADATAAYDALVALGAEHIGDFDRALLKPVILSTGRG